MKKTIVVIDDLAENRESAQEYITLRWNEESCKDIERLMIRREECLKASVRDLELITSFKEGKNWRFDEGRNEYVQVQVLVGVDADGNFVESSFDEVGTFVGGSYFRETFLDKADYEKTLKVAKTQLVDLQEGRDHFYEEKKQNLTKIKERTFECFAAEDYVSGMALILEKKPDYIITDMFFPEETGTGKIESGQSILCDLGLLEENIGDPTAEASYPMGVAIAKYACEKNINYIIASSGDRHQGKLGRIRYALEKSFYKSSDDAASHIACTDQGRGSMKKNSDEFWRYACNNLLRQGDS